MEVSPLLPGDHAKPTRGMKFFLGARGSLKSIKPGTLAAMFNFWALSPKGMVVY